MCKEPLGPHSEINVTLKKTAIRLAQTPYTDMKMVNVARLNFEKGLASFEAFY